MKAFIIDRYGKKDGVRIGEMPDPVLREGDVLVQVHAAGVNVLDSKIRDGEFKLLLPYRLPLILGNDVAGVVVRVGSRVRRFKPGDEVYARPDTDRNGGMCMQFNLEQIDTLLSTTRAVRRRLDLDRGIPDDILLRCIDLAEQAPSGGNIASRRWLIIRDPDIKAQLAALYREAGGNGIIATAERLRSSGQRRERVITSAAHLAQNLERVPALVLVTIWGTHDGSGRPGLFDSVLQAAWSFCLALRARGLGSAWTTVHLGRASEVAELLGIPTGVSQVVLLPVAWTFGTDFKPATRRPAAAITWFDHWGYTNERPSDGASLLAPGPGVTVEIDIAAPPARVWELVSDINVPSRFSTEFQGAEWVDSDGPRLGASFVGRNKRDDREWQTTSFVVACDPPRVFAWHVSDPERPGAQWRFELEPLGQSTRLRQHMTFGPGNSGTSRAMEQQPDQARQILARRRDQLRRNMELTTQGIKRLAESDGSADG